MNILQRTNSKAYNLILRTTKLLILLQDRNADDATVAYLMGRTSTDQVRRTSCRGFILKKGYLQYLLSELSSLD